jgi:hypothetical protein
MDGVDDLGVVDALQVYGRDSQVRVAQLALVTFNGTPSRAISTA